MFTINNILDNKMDGIHYDVHFNTCYKKIILNIRKL